MHLRMMRLISNSLFLVVAITTILLLQIDHISCFSSSSSSSRPPLSSLQHITSCSVTTYQTRILSDWRQYNKPTSILRHNTQLHALSEEEEKELKAVQEESRLKVLTDRRKTIRGILKAAEGTKNYRIKNGYVPEIDPETNKPIKSDGQLAVTLTAFVVAGGAVLLRVGGRAALVSALGLDFANDNPELRDGLDSVLNYASTIGTESELALFVLAWTAVKVFCFDAGGVVLALASGILFGGVLQGAVVSAFAATVGSSVAFGLAKLDTPVRKKALEVVDEYPSLRGIEKVVAKDGLKAILTLRLAPVLPIPIGMYNYVYGVTNIPYLDFAGGIFLGSLKPYLLDSYLGVFGKQIVDGTASDGGLQDALLLIALGVSVLIGVFASQLANETWDSINEEIELDKAEKAAAIEDDDDDEKDGVMREFMGMAFPQPIVGFQLALQEADKRVNTMIEEEYNAKVWNCTEEELKVSKNNPANLPDSPEVVEANTGFDFGASICAGLVLSPALLGAYLKYADPLYVEEEVKQDVVSSENDTILDKNKEVIDLVRSEEVAVAHDSTLDVEGNAAPSSDKQRERIDDITAIQDDLLSALSLLRTRLQRDIDNLK